MEESEIHAIAVLLQQSYGAASVDAALQRARGLSANGQFPTASIWERIATAVRALERAKGAVHPPAATE